MSFWQRSSQNPVEIIVKWVLISFLNTQQMTITWMSCARLGRQKSHGKNAHMKRIFHADWKPGRKTAELCGFPSLIVCQCAAHAALLEHSVIRKIFVWSSNTPTKSSFHWSGSVAKPFGCEVPPRTSPIRSSHTHHRSPALWGSRWGGKAVSQTRPFCLVVFYSCLVPKLSPLPESQYVLLEAQWYFQSSALIHTREATSPRTLWQVETRRGLFRWLSGQPGAHTGDVHARTAVDTRRENWPPVREVLTIKGLCGRI